MSDPILIWGAGAIGGTMGAYLVRAGHPVLFVDLVAEHVAEIAAGRLRISGPIDEFTVGAPAVTPDRLTGHFRRIFLAVKAHHTEGAARMLLPHLAPDGYVVSMQNGLNEITIAGIVGKQRTIGAFVNYGADWHGPGEIMFGNRGAVVVGELDGSTTPRLTALHATLKDFEPNAVLSDNIWGYLWGKCAYGSLLKASALTNETIANFIRSPALRQLNVRLVQEVLAVAAAEGVAVLGFNGFDPESFRRNDAAGIGASIEQMTGFNRRTAKPRSGIWRDLAVRKRQTDVAAQLGPVVATAEHHGIAVPTIRKLIALIGAIERGEREMGLPLAEELAEVARAAAA
ncbi:MAG: ketopantoate reductase family protein [Alphaproteobacteria bacterium]|nr:ketopantoate reductase family protein [Alphaproteobacteria bacterium]